MPDTIPKNLAEVLASLDAQGIDDYRRYDTVRRFLSAKAWEKKIPISGAFELTPLCNLDCKMCYVHLNREQMAGQDILPASTWIHLIDQAIDAGMIYATLTGGECLTHSGFREIYLHLRNRGIQVSVLTNGVLIGEDPAWLDFFKRNPPASMQITLYGSNEDTYERVTGRRAFVKAMTAAQSIHGMQIPLNVALTPNLYLLDDLPDLLRMVEELGFHISINCGLFSARKDTGREGISCDISPEAYVALYLLQRSIKGIPPPQRCDLLEGPYVCEGQDGNEIPCGTGRCHFSINWKGDMKGCNVLEAFQTAPLADGFAKAWKMLSDMVDACSLPQACMRCAYMPVCINCVAQHFVDEEGSDLNPRVCEWTKRMYEEGLLARKEAL